MKIEYQCDFGEDLRNERIRILYGDLKKNHNLKTYAGIVWLSAILGAIPWFLGYRLIGGVTFMLVLSFSLYPFFRINKLLKTAKTYDERERESVAIVTDEEIKVIDYNGSEHRWSWDSFDSYYDGTLGCHIFLDQINGVIIPFKEIRKHLPERDFVDFVKTKIPKGYKRLNSKR